MLNGEVRRLKRDYVRMILFYEIDDKPVKKAGDLKDYVDNLDSGEIIRLQVLSQTSGGNNFDRLVFLEIP